MAARRRGGGIGNAPTLAVTLSGTEYTTRKVQQSGGGSTRQPHQVTATVDLPDGVTVRLTFRINRGKWSLVA